MFVSFPEYIFVHSVDHEIAVYSSHCIVSGAGMVALAAGYDLGEPVTVFFYAARRLWQHGEMSYNEFLCYYGNRI